MTAFPVESSAGGALFDCFLGFQNEWKDLLGDRPLINSMAKAIASGTSVEQLLRVDF